MNDAGQVVGQADTRAFLWQGDRLIDLNTHLPPQSGWSLYGANAINNRGQIVGWGTYSGPTRAFLMTPTLPSLPLPYVGIPHEWPNELRRGNHPAGGAAAGMGLRNWLQCKWSRAACCSPQLPMLPAASRCFAFGVNGRRPLEGAHAIFARAAYASGLVTTSATVAVSVVLPPSLIYGRAGSELQLAWPASPATFLLETTTNLALPASWLPDTNVPDLLDGTNYVNVGLTDACVSSGCGHAPARDDN